jgi:hypothetical protein
MEAAIQKKQPNKIDIGAVFTHPVGRRASHVIQRAPPSRSTAPHKYL